MNTRAMVVGGRFNYVANWPTATHVMIEALPERNPEIEFLSFNWSTTPEFETEAYRDLYGNHKRRFLLPVGDNTFGWEAVVRIPDALDEYDLDAEQVPVDKLPVDVLPYLSSSRYVHADLIGKQAWKMFGDYPAGYRRAAEVQHWVWQNIEYRTGSTGSAYTANDCFNNRYGICRDFAQTFVMFCRALNMPARYISGILPDLDVPPEPCDMDFHAFAQVYLGGRWWTFDPRWGKLRKGHIIIGHGRDAADTPLIVTFGNPWLKRMTVTYHEIPDPETGTFGPPEGSPPGDLSPLPQYQHLTKASGH